MSLGLAIVIFLISAILLLILYSLITKYFAYKLQKALLQINQQYSLVQGIQGQRQDINQGQYQDFVHKRIQQRKKKLLQQNKKYKAAIEMTSVIGETETSRQPLKNSSNDNIYQVSKLKQKLGIQQLITNTKRSLGSLKQYKAQRLQIAKDFQLIRSNTLNSNKSSDLSRSNTLKKQDINQTIKQINQIEQVSNQNQTGNQSENRKIQPMDVKHTFMNKLVGYEETGVTIYIRKVLEIWKDQSQQIRQNKKITKKKIGPLELQFSDTLEAYGFIKQQYEAYKFLSTVEIQNMKPKQPYKIKLLKKSDQKQNISLAQFCILKEDIDFQMKYTQM